MAEVPAAVLARYNRRPDEVTAAPEPADEFPRQPVLEPARLLLEAGAGPNDGYLWHDLASPFTALTGAFGEGEGGQARYLGQDAVAEFLATWPG